MDNGTLLTLDEAATRCGYRKRDLRALLRDGRLPAVRAGGHWRIAAADLALLPARPSSRTAAAPRTVVDSPPVQNTDPVAALIELLRERDRKLAELQEERAQLTGQVGFLLGQLTEREERILALERAATVPQVLGSSSDPEEPVLLIEERILPEVANSALGPRLTVTGSLPDQGSPPMDGDPALNDQPGGHAATAGSSAPSEAFSLMDSPALPMAPRPAARRRRGLFGLFRAREPIG